MCYIEPPKTFKYDEHQNVNKIFEIFDKFLHPNIQTYKHPNILATITQFTFEAINIVKLWLKSM